MSIGIAIFEAFFFKLSSNVVYPKAVSDGGEDFEGLFCFFHLFMGIERINCPHVVKPIGKLYDYDPDIFNHC